MADVAAYSTIEAARKRAGHLPCCNSEIDTVSTSASTVRHFVEMLGAERAPDLLAPTVIAAIGRSRERSAARPESVVVPGQYTIPALVEALVDHFAANPVSLSAS